MTKTTRKILALTIALLMALTLFTSCKKEAVTETPPETSAPPPTTSSTPPPTTTPSPTPTPTPTPTPPPPPPPPQTLVVGYREFSEKFSTFFAKTGYDVDVGTNMTQLLLLGNDRAGNVILNGIKGETIPYNGVDYFYDGPADIGIVQKPNGTVDYNIKLREDLVFSDGVPMTIDDVIFNMYVYSDPTYDGGVTFYSLPIIGMNAYRTGVNDAIYDKYLDIALGIMDAGFENTDFSAWTEAQQEAFWKDYFYPQAVMFIQEIIDYCVANYGKYLPNVNDDEVALGMFVWGFADFDDDDVFTTLDGYTFDLEGDDFPTIDDYLYELLVAYDGDIQALSDTESAGMDLYGAVITDFISGEGPKDPAAGGEIKNITGIKKTGPYSCTVTTEYFEATSIYQFAFGIAPLHYYGDTKQYDYDKNMFGFPKGDLSMMKAKGTVPLGAGAYKFLSYESGVVSFEANEKYYKGEPKIKYVRFQEVPDPDMLAGIVAGTFDIADPSFSKDTVQSIKGYNSNGELSGNIITTNTVDNLGYGYIGICANTVNVGGEPGSRASKDLRSAFATLYAVYRNTVNNSYYGERASTIQYPISNTSWAAPRPNDVGYRIAYSTDVNGKDIYKDNMTEAERYAAALEAAIGFFKAAGYTWDDASRKFTAAPAGAQMTYEVIIPANGVGEHPAYNILTAVKDALAPIGITLQINDPANSNLLWDALESGTAEMWTAAWQATLDPDMYQVYHSSNAVGKGGTDSNHYAIADELLDKLIIEARKSDNQAYRKATYKQCLEIILEWAVEIPNYQRQNAVIFSTERVNLDTVTPDITTFWTWMNDLELLEMN